MTHRKRQKTKMWKFSAVDISAICCRCVITIFSARLHICLARYMQSPVPLSVCLSLRWEDHRKTVEFRIMKFSQHGSCISLVFRGKVHPEILIPRAGASNKGGVGKIISFLSLSLNISKTVADTAKVTIIND